MKIKEWALFFFGIILVWSAAGLFINNPVILPMPSLVIEQMVQQFLTVSFYKTVLNTVIRAIGSLMISLALAFMAGFFANGHSSFYTYFEKVLIILRSIPNVTYIILLLFWVKRSYSVYIVALLLLFPILFDILYQSIKDIERTWKDVFILYPQRFLTRLRYVYLPLLKSPLKAGLNSAVSLAFKVCVMAELLASVAPGIGRNLQLERLDLNLAGVIAWTIWLLICVFIFNKLISRILDWICR